MADPLIQQVVSQLAAMHTQTEGNFPAQKAAIAWVQGFQNKPEAWMVSDQLLRTSFPTRDSEIHHFAATTLHTKIRRDFKDLPREAHASLRDSLLSHMMRYKADQLWVLEKVCMCIAALSIRMEGWPDPVKDIIATYGRPETIMPLMALLAVLPEECHRDKENLERVKRRAFEDQLNANAESVLQTTYAALTHSGSNTKIQEAVFRCFVSWLRHAKISPLLLVNNPLVVASFDALQCPDLVETVVDAICELIRINPTVLTQKAKQRNRKEGIVKFNTGRSSLETRQSQEQLVQLIFTKVLPLKAKYTEAVANDNWTLSHGICRIFTELAETNIPIFEQFGIEAQTICATLLECTTHPDPGIFILTLNFWQSLATSLLTIPEDKKTPTMTAYSAIFATLAQIVMKHMLIPSGFEQWAADAQDEFKTLRHEELTPTLRSASAIAGHEELLVKIHSDLVVYLGQYPQTQEWKPIEALLYAVLALVRTVPDVPLVQYTSLLVVSRFCEWLQSHPTLLSPLLDYVISKISVPDLAPAAAFSFRNLCDTCATHLCTCMDSIFLVIEASAKFNLEINEQKDILVGVSYVISALQSPQLVEALQRLCLPVAQALQNFAVAPVASSADTNGLSDTLYKLGTIFRHVKPPQDSSPCYIVFEKMWPLIDQLFTKYNTTDTVARALCSCCKDVISTCAHNILPLLPTIFDRLVTVLDLTRNTVPMAVLHSCIKKLPPDCLPSASSTLTQLYTTTLTRVTQRVMSLLPNSDEFTLHPDIVCNYFLLTHQFITDCPHTLCSCAPLLTSLLSWSMMGLQLQEHEGAKSLLRFYEGLFVAARKMPSFFSTLQSILETTLPNNALPIGPTLVQGLLLAAAGWQPMSQIPMLCDIFIAMRAASVQMFVSMLQRALVNFPLATVSQQTKQDLATSLSVQPLKETNMRHVLEDWYQVCTHPQPAQQVSLVVPPTTSMSS
ncbi:armadillo-type protein [Pelomyxa schiedti]|nr:armadillo-type protein [Pelomyxa schiedti]